MNNINLFHAIKQNMAPEQLTLLVEISQGDSNKYEYNRELGAIELDRVLFAPLYYPVNYCDIPGTWNDGDNDPLDAVLFSSFPINPGVIAYGRVIGLLEVVDNGEVDDKIICVNARDPRFEHVNTFADFSPYQLKDIQTFFASYKTYQTGVGSVKVGKFKDFQNASVLIKKSIDSYNNRFNI